MPRFYPAWGWALGQGPQHSVLSPPLNPVPSCLLSFQQRRVLASHTTPLTSLSITASSKSPGLYSQPRFLFSHPCQYLNIIVFLACSLFLSVHPFIYFSIHLFIYLSIHLPPIKSGINSFVYQFI